MTQQKPTISFSDVKARVPIDVALAHYGVTPKPEGARLFAPCPIHQGTNPKGFVISSDRRAWYCFGDCGAGGSVLDLIVRLENCSLPEAARLIAIRHGLA